MAKSKFDKLVGKLESEGKSPAQAKGIAGKVGREKFGVRGMEKKAVAGKRKAAAARASK